MRELHMSTVWGRWADKMAAYGRIRSHRDVKKCQLQPSRIKTWPEIMASVLLQTLLYHAAMLVGSRFMGLCCIAQCHT